MYLDVYLVVYLDVYIKIQCARYITIHQDTYPIGNYTKKDRKPHVSPKHPP